jgi:hypothetical protein
LAVYIVMIVVSAGAGLVVAGRPQNAPAFVIDPAAIPTTTTTVLPVEG